MDIKAVLFDLDGTLLPMDMNEFTGGYFKIMCRKVAPYGYEEEDLISNIWKGTASMVRNDGSRLNREAFWDTFAAIYGEEKLKDKVLFDEFYANEFDQARKFCGFNPLAGEVVRASKDKGFRLILATNPMFPEVATLARIGWAGLEPSDFEYITTYDNSCTCKPNPAYFLELCKKVSILPQECLMVGNDTEEDMIAETVGMKVFLLTDCLINKKNRDISAYPHGGFEELLSFIERLA